MGLAHIPHREGDKLPYTLKALQMPIKANIHTIPIIKKFD